MNTKLVGIQKSTGIIYNTHLVSRGSSGLNLSPILNYAFDVSSGNSDLNSCLIFNYAFDVSLRVNFTNTFL